MSDDDKELFRIQCRILDLGTNTSLSGSQLRRKLMMLRDEIISFRERAFANEQEGKWSRLQPLLSSGSL
jgi:hypothetical protein